MSLAHDRSFTETLMTTNLEVLKRLSEVADQEAIAARWRNRRSVRKPESQTAWYRAQARAYQARMNVAQPEWADGMPMAQATPLRRRL